MSPTTTSPLTASPTAASIAAPTHTQAFNCANVVNPVDAVIAQCDGALRTLFNVGNYTRPYPVTTPTPALYELDTDNNIHTNIDTDTDLTPAQRRHAAGLMRVNHVGEVCAQALYAGQMLAARSLAVRDFNAQAALEERDHLLWTAQRLRELKVKPSVLNPLWYCGSWALGAVAGMLGDKTSLSFVAETEAQVEAHLHSHLNNPSTLLPENDHVSRAIVAQMMQDEAAHGQQAAQLGGSQLPAPLRSAMQLSAKLMTKTAYYI